MLRRTGISTIMVVAVAFVALAAGPPQLPIQQSTSPTGIVWAPGFSYDSATLVVSGPEGLVVREIFGSGEQLAYGLKDAIGAALADGSYTWQLTVRRTLTGAEQSALKAAREEAERLRVEANELRRNSQRGNLGSAVASDADAKGGARVDAQQIEAADRAAERAEMRFEGLRDELEQQNGKFFLRPSGNFVVEGGSATFDSLSEAIPPKLRRV